jgi:hypothetical protein
MQHRAALEETSGLDPALDKLSLVALAVAAGSDASMAGNGPQDGAVGVDYPSRQST